MEIFVRWKTRHCGLVMALIPTKPATSCSCVTELHIVTAALGFCLHRLVRRFWGLFLTLVLVSALVHRQEVYMCLCLVFTR